MPITTNDPKLKAEFMAEKERMDSDKKEIAEILQHCNYSEAFIETANDLQIMDAISQCYEQYKVLKK